MDRITLTRFLIEEQRVHHSLPADLRLLIEAAARVVTTVSAQRAKGKVTGMPVLAGSDTVQGEAQKNLDVIANDLLLHANGCGKHLAAMAPEEMEAVFPIPDRYPMGEYLLVFDSRGGSSDVDAKALVGTIFSVLACPGGWPLPYANPLLQPGRAQVAAGYVIDDPSTMLVLTVGTATHRFTLDREFGTWVLTHPNNHTPAIAAPRMRFRALPAVADGSRIAARHAAWQA